MKYTTCVVEEGKISIACIDDSEGGTSFVMTQEQVAGELNRYSQQISILLGVIKHLEEDVDDLEGVE
jgi:hypothetical protein